MGWILSLAVPVSSVKLYISATPVKRRAVSQPQVVMNKHLEKPYRQWGRSWLLLCGAFGLHIVDEAVTNFLSLYNPAVEKIKESVPFLPLPTFTFESWITLLIGTVILLFFLSKFAYSGRSWMRPLSYLFACVMLGNSLLHLGGSLVTGEILPGAYSSPVLLVGALYLLWSLQKISKSH